MAVFTMTMLFIGTIIGAGFATGAEIVTFFGNLRLPLWLIALLVGLTTFALIALSIALNHPTPRTICRPLNYLFVVLYFIVFTAMTAGVTQLAGVWMSLLSLIIACLVVQFGFDKMARFNTLVVISIVIVLFGVCFRALFIPVRPFVDYGDLPKGVMWAILYAGLNCMMLPELVAAAAPQHSKRTLYLAGLITATLIGLFVLLILHTVTVTETADVALPLLASSHHPATFAVILLAMLTSQYAALFAIIQKVNAIIPSVTKKPRTVLVSISGLAFISSFFGFNQILQWGYPVIGAIISCFLFLSWLISWGQRRLSRQSVHH